MGEAIGTSNPRASLSEGLPVRDELAHAANYVYEAAIVAVAFLLLLTAAI